MIKIILEHFGERMNVAVEKNRNEKKGEGEKKYREEKGERFIVF